MAPTVLFKLRHCNIHIQETRQMDWEINFRIWKLINAYRIMGYKVAITEKEMGMSLKVSD